MLLNDEDSEERNDEIAKPYSDVLIKYKQNNNAFLPKTFQILEESLKKVEKFIRVRSFL